METQTQPSLESQSIFDSVVDNEKVLVPIIGRNKFYLIGWLHNGAIRKITHIMLEKGDERQVSCKCAATIILGTFLKVKLFYWFLWRWFFYVKDYTDLELSGIIEEGKKKLQLNQYYMNTILLTGMKDSIMTMTRTEVERFLQEQRLAQQGR